MGKGEVCRIWHQSLLNAAGFTARRICKHLGVIIARSKRAPQHGVLCSITLRSLVSGCFRQICICNMYVRTTKYNTSSIFGGETRGHLNHYTGLASHEPGLG